MTVYVVVGFYGDHFYGVWATKAEAKRQIENLRKYGDDAYFFSTTVEEDGKDDCITCGPIGSRGDTTTIFRDGEKGVCVNCGCFSGSLDDFEKAVNETHPYDQHGMEYRALIALARIRFAYVFDEVT